jgi:hypothetical protein
MAGQRWPVSCLKTPLRRRRPPREYQDSGGRGPRQSYCLHLAADISTEMPILAQKMALRDIGAAWQYQNSGFAAEERKRAAGANSFFPFVNLTSSRRLSMKRISAN